MREIFYKAKRTDNGEWVEGYYFKFMDKSYITDMERTFMEAFYTQKSVVDFHMRAYEVEADTVCRCTGIRDCNVDKIWENDVVRYYDDLAEMEKEDLIKWNETYASFTRLHESKMGLQYLCIDRRIAKRCKVIGNIFDNPELVERN